MSEHETKLVGGGWGIHNQIETVGDVGGATHADLVARDRDGVLWLYLGYGNGTFAPRTRIGAGWNAYSDLVGIGDGNRDGRPDLFAYDESHNRTYYCRGTGKWQAPFAGRTSSASPDQAGNPYPYNHMT